MVKKFENHPYINNTIDKRRKKNCQDNNLDTTYSDYATLFRHPDQDEIKILFEHINKGVELYESGVDLDDLSENDTQTILDLVASRQIIYVTNLKLVYYFANKYSFLQSNSFSFDDLIQEGNIGLSEAISRFDISRDIKFSYYASQYIKKQIRRGTADKSRCIRIPVHRHDKYISVRIAVEQLRNSLNQEPADDEIIEYIKQETGFEMTINEYHKLMQDGTNHLISLDEKIGNNSGDGEELMYFIRDNSNLSFGIDKLINLMASKSEVDKIFKKSGIDDREKLIVGIYLGLDPEEIEDFTLQTTSGKKLTYSQLFYEIKSQKNSDVTFRDIGERLGLSHERIRQIMVKALRKMKDSLEKEKKNNLFNQKFKGFVN